MPSSPSIVEKISSTTETEPSVGGEEGTANRLNEAPRCNCPGTIVSVYWVSSLEMFACCNCDGFVGSMS